MRIDRFVYRGRDPEAAGVNPLAVAWAGTQVYYRYYEQRADTMLSPASFTVVRQSPDTLYVGGLQEFALALVQRSPRRYRAVRPRDSCADRPDRQVEFREVGPA